MNPAASLSYQLLRRAYEANASDLHFFPSDTHTDIYFRMLGERTFIRTITQTEYQLLLTYYKFTSGMDIGEMRKPQNGIIIDEITGVRINLRLSTLPVYHMESLAIRLLPQDETYSLDSLFLFDRQREELQNIMTYRNGIILFTGPTGCGKTTTMYALLQETLKKNALQIVTLEDPIEKELPNILQVEINEKAGISYQSGLKAALRHDPDVIMLGEIRDEETAQFAFESALTGHLIVSTIHAKNTLETVPRLLELGVKRDYIKQSLITVAALELLPILQKNQVKRRASVVELLQDELLEQCIRGENVDITQHKQSFHHLRKKAYAYGFLSDTTYFS